MANSITFPKGFTALKKHPGYFWQSYERRLYSIKSGILTPLKLNYGTYRVPGIGAFGPHYQISNRGRRHYIFCDRIESYLAEGEYIIKQELPG